MTDTIVDLATERAQRRMLAERAAESGEAFIDGLQLAGQTFANLGWLLAAPIRAHDKELTHGIYQLVLQRLGRIVDDAVAEGEWASWNATHHDGPSQGRGVCRLHGADDRFGRNRKPGEATVEGRRNVKDVMHGSCARLRRSG